MLAAVSADGAPPSPCAKGAGGERVPAEALRIGGLTPLTTIDFPGKLAAVVFCQGCPWRCGYCQNTGLLDAAAPAAHTWADVQRLLHARRGLLDGVVFSGGEPTLQVALPDALARVRAMGFATGLHTAGIYPERLAALLPLLDWVGLDIKAPPQRYDAITRAPGSGAKAWASLRHLLASGVAHECRTTWHAGLFSEDELQTLADTLAAAGVRHWALQECRAAGAPGWALTGERAAVLGRGFASFTLRRA